jgi:dUTPase
MPVIIADFSFGLGKERGTEGFGSSGDNVWE